MCTKDPRIINWQREIKNVKFFINKISKLGSECIKSFHSVNKNVQQEALIVQNFRRANDALHNLAEFIGHYLPSEGGAVKQIQNHIHAECETKILKEQEKLGQQKQMRELLVKENKKLKAQCQQWEKNTFEQNDALNSELSELSMLQRSAQDTLKKRNELILHLQEQLFLCNEERERLVSQNAGLTGSFEEKTHSLKNDLRYYIKQQEINLEKNKELAKSLADLETLYKENKKILETQMQLSEELRRELHSKDTQLFELQNYIRNVELQNQKQFDLTSKENLQTKTANVQYESQIQKLQYQLMEQREIHRQLNVKTQHYEPTIVKLENSVSYYKQEVEKVVQENQNLKLQLLEFSNKNQSGSSNQQTVNQRSLEDQDKIALEANTKKRKEGEVEEPYVKESLDKIAKLSEIAQELKTKVEKFTGTKEDKAYLHLKELLIRTVVKLDNVETEGHLIIRERRKEVIRFVQDLHNTLDNKAK